MSGACTSLAFTGVGYPVIPIALAAVACLVIGIILLSRRKRPGRRRLSVALLLALCLCAAIGIESPMPATAVSPDCGGAGPTLVVTQSSQVTGMGPGVAALPIVGIVTNVGPNSISLTEVTVRVASVTRASHAVAGRCGAGDYVIENPRMAVAEIVRPRASVEFRGATIGFIDRGRNQDACKGAIVHLAYDLDGT